MNVTFGKFWNLLETTEENSKSLDIIRSGNNLKSLDCGNFWDDFINLCGNAESMSELLDIPKEKITGWSGKISNLRKEVEEKDTSNINKKNRIIKNGEI
jgi:hypothetical protein